MTYNVDFSPQAGIRYLGHALAKRHGIEVAYKSRSFSPRSEVRTPSSGEVAKYMRDMRAKRDKSA